MLLSVALNDQFLIFSLQNVHLCRKMRRPLAHPVIVLYEELQITRVIMDMTGALVVVAATKITEYVHPKFNSGIM